MTSAPVSCCDAPELRKRLKISEQVGDAPQAAHEPRHWDFPGPVVLPQMEWTAPAASMCQGAGRENR